MGREDRPNGVVAHLYGETRRCTVGAQPDGAATRETLDVLIPGTIRHVGDNEDGKRSVPT